MAALGFAACDRRAPITSCEQDLGGEYVAIDVAGERHWMITDRGDTLEIYPVFPDLPAGSLEVAPRTLELWREGGVLRGQTRRRYMQGAAACTAKVPATITRCDGALEIVHAETAPPLGFAPCTWGRTEPAVVERWTRR